MILRILWWRIRYAAWYLGWQILFRVAPSRTLHGITVGLQPAWEEHIEGRAFERVEAGLSLIAEYEPRRLRRIGRDIRIWVERTAYAPAYYVEALRLCVIDRTFVTADDTAPAMIAVAVVHEATHARLFRRNIPYAEAIRPRIEAICDTQSAAFARRLPEGESLARRILQQGPADVTHWTSDNLDRRWRDAKHAELVAVRQEVEDSNLPGWLKRLMRRVLLSRAA
jgi:hypothetical protein